MDPYDVAIVGGGMAGLSAALWCRRLGLACLVLEARERAGGQIHFIGEPIRDYPGFRGSAPQLIRTLEEQLHEEGIEIKYRNPVGLIGSQGEAGFLEAPGGRIAFRAAILAMGLRRRRLWDLKREPENLYYGSSGIRDRFRGRRVAVVGGGDGALENALRLSEAGARVVLVHRGDRFRARPEFIRELEARDEIEIHLKSNVVEFRGHDRIHEILVEGAESSAWIPVDGLVVKIGQSPASEIVRHLCSLDGGGYIVVDREQRTTIPWLWAAGDICTPLDPSLAVAAGQASLAVRSIERYLRGESHFRDQE